MPIHFNGVIDYEDFRRAHRAHTMVDVLSLKTAVWWLVLLAVCVALFIFSGEPAAFIPLSVCMAVLAVLLIWRPLFNPRRRVWARLRPLHEPLHGEASEEGIAMEAETWRSAFAWGNLHKQVQTDDVVLLYHLSGVFNLIPRRLFASEQDWQAFRALVAEKVPGGRHRNVRPRLST